MPKKKFQRKTGTLSPLTKKRLENLLGGKPDVREPAPAVIPPEKPFESKSSKGLGQMTDWEAEKNEI